MVDEMADWTVELMAALMAELSVGMTAARSACLSDLL